MIYSGNTSITTNPNQTNIVFECSDLRRDMGLLLLKRKKDEKFELHLHNHYTCQALAMVLSLEDLARMFESLEEYCIRENRQQKKNKRYDF